jgi:hypothetical protein
MDTLPFELLADLFRPWCAFRWTFRSHGEAYVESARPIEDLSSVVDVRLNLTHSPATPDVR